MYQLATDLSFIQARLDPSTKCRIAEPVEHELSSLPTNFPQCFDKSVCPRYRSNAL